MYSSGAGIVYGFHGCEANVAGDIVNGRTFLRPSMNSWDWLGHGMYFWENSPSRALEFIESVNTKRARPSSGTGSADVVGAAIHLGNCLDLLDYQNLHLLKEGYEILSESMARAGKPIPENRASGDLHELLMRDLDCAVIETIHYYRKLAGLPPFDSVRGVFWEGKELYPNAGFREKDHIQICVINPNCIRGFFFPRSMNQKYPKV